MNDRSRGPSTPAPTDTTLTAKDNPSVAHLASAYAGRGWAVLPLWSPGQARRCACPAADCGSPAKHPHALAPHGLKDATTDLETIARWWKLTPQANVGIATGAVSGLVVLDVDGELGQESFRALLAEHGGDESFRAIWVRTGSGGWHGYMRHPGGTIANSAGKLGAGLDIRGDGGYVVAPPSLHASGRRYEWLRGQPGQPPAIPPWLAEPLAPPVPAEKSTRPARVTGSGMTPYVIAAIEDEARAVADAPVGGRNDALNRAAFSLGTLIGAGLISEATVSEVLTLAGRAAGLTEREIVLTIRSGLRAGAAHPREVA